MGPSPYQGQLHIVSCLSPVCPPALSLLVLQDRHFHSTMSLESAKAFFDACLSGSLSLQPDQLITELSSKEESEILPYVKSLGYDFTQEEMQQVLKENYDSLGTSLSQEELATIIGGKGHLSTGETAGIGAGAGVAAGIAAGGVGIGVAAAAASAAVAASPVLWGSMGAAAAAASAACF